MANTSDFCIKIDADLKNSAEKILSQLGITPTGAINMLYKQIVSTKGMPFEPCLPSSAPTAIGGMTQAQLDMELTKGIDSLNTEQTYSIAEVETELTKIFDTR
jgi:DNA-damage-inducible protein J